MPDLSKRIIEVIIDHILVCENRFKRINSPEDFIKVPDGDIRLDAIAMRLQAIGENMKRLLRLHPDLKTRYVELDWDAIIRLRDFISHHYESLDHELIYNICKIHLVTLKDILIKESKTD